VLLYWLIMSAYSVFGVNEFSARFWSATLAIGTTLGTYVIARRLASPRIGLIAAVALSTSLMFDVAARAATPDSVLIFCSTTALMLYVVGTFSRQGNEVQTTVPNCYFPRNLCLVVAMYTMMGLGVLAKGPVGCLIPMAVIGMFMLVQTLSPQTTVRRTDHWFARLAVALMSLVRPFHPLHFLKTFWAMKPVLAASVVLVIAVPWYLLVDHRTEGQFTRMFFIGEHFGRATTAMENHAGGFWFYPLAILAGFFPWSIFWGPVAVGLIGKRRRYPAATTLMLCLVGVQVGLFTLAQTKLPSYVTPCYPALAVLTAICLEEFSLGRTAVHQGWFYAAFAGLILAGVLIMGGLGFAATKFFPHQIWIAAWGLIPMIVGGVLIWMQTKNHTRLIPAVFAGAAALFCWGLFGVGTTAIDEEQHSHLILDAVQAAPDDSAVAAYGCLESSWVFYGGRPIRELILGDSSNPVAPNPIADPRDRLFWQPKRQVSIEAFLNSHPGAMFITTGDHVEALKKRLPEHFEVIQTADYFLRNKQIYLLGARADYLAHRDDGQGVDRQP
jgi:4-amino-4-deoxy-L-arabinose transferase-like glycosyltransferase